MCSLFRLSNIFTLLSVALVSRRTTSPYHVGISRCLLLFFILSIFHISHVYSTVASYMWLARMAQPIFLVYEDFLNRRTCIYVTKTFYSCVHNSCSDTKQTIYQMPTVVIKQSNAWKRSHIVHIYFIWKLRTQAEWKSTDTQRGQGTDITKIPNDKGCNHSHSFDYKTAIIETKVPKVTIIYLIVYEAKAMTPAKRSQSFR